MKFFINNLLEFFHPDHKHPKNVVEHLFTVQGNGIFMDNLGYLCDNNRSTDIYNFPEPEPLDYIYPWSDEDQPFKKICRL